MLRGLKKKLPTLREVEKDYPELFDSLMGLDNPNKYGSDIRTGNAEVDFVHLSPLDMPPPRNEDEFSKHYLRAFHFVNKDLHRGIKEGIYPTPIFVRMLVDENKISLHMTHHLIKHFAYAQLDRTDVTSEDKTRYLLDRCRRIVQEISSNKVWNDIVAFDLEAIFRIVLVCFNDNYGVEDQHFPSFKVERTFTLLNDVLDLLLIAYENSKTPACVKHEFMAYRLFVGKMFYCRKPADFLNPKILNKDPDLRNMPRDFLQSQPFRRLMSLYDLFSQGNFSALDREIKRPGFLTFRLLFNNFVYPFWIPHIFFTLSKQEPVDPRKLAHRLNIPSALRSQFAEFLESGSLTNEKNHVKFNREIFRFTQFKWSTKMKKSNYVLRGLLRVAHSEAALFVLSMNLHKIAKKEADLMGKPIPMVDDNIEFDEIVASEYAEDDYVDVSDNQHDSDDDDDLNDEPQIVSSSSSSSLSSFLSSSKDPKAKETASVWGANTIKTTETPKQVPTFGVKPVSTLSKQETVFFEEPTPKPKPKPITTPTPSPFSNIPASSAPVPRSALASAPTLVVTPSFVSPLSSSGAFAKPISVPKPATAPLPTPSVTTVTPTAPLNPPASQAQDKALSSSGSAKLSVSGARIATMAADPPAPVVQKSAAELAAEALARKEALRREKLQRKKELLKLQRRKEKEEIKRNEDLLIQRIVFDRWRLKSQKYQNLSGIGNSLSQISPRKYTEGRLVAPFINLEALLKGHDWIQRQQKNPNDVPTSLYFKISIVSVIKSTIDLEDQDVHLKSLSDDQIDAKLLKMVESFFSTTDPDTIASTTTDGISVRPLLRNVSVVDDLHRRLKISVSSVSIDQNALQQPSVSSALARALKGSDLVFHVLQAGLVHLQTFISSLLEKTIENHLKSASRTGWTVLASGNCSTTLVERECNAFLDRFTSESKPSFLLTRQKIFLPITDAPLSKKKLQTHIVSRLEVLPQSPQIFATTVYDAIRTALDVKPFEPYQDIEDFLIKFSNVVPATEEKVEAIQAVYSRLEKNLPTPNSFVESFNRSLLKVWGRLAPPDFCKRPVTYFWPPHDFAPDDSSSILPDHSDFDEDKDGGVEYANWSDKQKLVRLKQTMEQLTLPLLPVFRKELSFRKSKILCEKYIEKLVEKHSSRSVVIKADLDALLVSIEPRVMTKDKQYYITRHFPWNSFFLSVFEVCIHHLHAPDHIYFYTIDPNAPPELEPGPEPEPQVFQEQLDEDEPITVLAKRKRSNSIVNIEPLPKKTRLEEMKENLERLRNSIRNKHDTICTEF